MSAFPNCRFRLTSLPNLVLIEIMSPGRLWNPAADHLCLELARYPEHCPLLEQLHFDVCVAWDIFFLMLERRNLGFQSVKRIHTVILPFVPPHLRRLLNTLLDGKHVERPSLVSLSLEETREIICDPAM